VISLKPVEDLTLDPDRYRLTWPQRRALWNNEISMFIVLAMPLIIATFWYGSTIQVVVNGEVTAAPSLGRGIGLTAIVSFVLIVGSATWLFIQPAAERVAHARPVRGWRRMSYGAFDGLLAFLITYQSLTEAETPDEVFLWVTSILLGVAVAAIAYVAMRSMVDIPPSDPNPIDVWRAQIDDRHQSRAGNLKTPSRRG
jgi:hypothetical protein